MVFRIDSVRQVDEAPPLVQNRALDQWWTDPVLARWFVQEGFSALKKALLVSTNRSLAVPPAFVEPAAGYGAILRAIDEYHFGCPYFACEIDPRFEASLVQRAPRLQDIYESKDPGYGSQLCIGDFLSEGVQTQLQRFCREHRERGRLIIGKSNPPYSKPRKTIGLEFARALSEHCDATFLLVHAGFLHGSKRYAGFWESHGDRCFWMRFIVNRPQFGIEHEDNLEDVSTPRTDYVALGVLSPQMPLLRPVANDVDWVPLDLIYSTYGAGIE